MIFNGLLYAEQKPMTSVWMREVNNCNESYIFSAFSNTFKLSLMVSGDNGVSDYFNNAYDFSGKIRIVYPFLYVLLIVLYTFLPKGALYQALTTTPTSKTSIYHSHQH
jgi:hypothetical protein